MPRPVHAATVSRLLRSAGFMPSQPSRTDPFPSLQVHQRGDHVVIDVRHRGNLRPNAVCEVLRAASYDVKSDTAHYEDVDPWTTVWVRRSTDA